MARPRSEDKRNAILEAATEVVAEQGVSAPTAKIAKRAGVAEGSLFTYFENKDVLLNQLYLALKEELRHAMLDGFPAAERLAAQAHHVWNGYVDWGVANPLKRKAMSQLTVSDRITAQTKEAGSAGFARVSAMLQESLAGGALKDQPPSFVGAILSSLAETTMDFITREPALAERYKSAGFEAFWAAIAKH
ncbi:TetR/AcrR family transcriptional regulator [Dyella acidiphila]|uniref:TetR/AcrR family transcriptional regulator n=1 Tax=Dyella acidiphila TaxID=2775866 RepID=A0ABR9GEH9_9GAMM|nr:TetR/AcrR family transcriptional regulator [Dyella acidiphila]MBE1162451.1 TetR/AcrR family transcriptional regulator [Dyella acidiphila]